MTAGDIAAIRRSTASLLKALQRRHPAICGKPARQKRYVRKTVDLDARQIDALIDRAARITGIGRKDLVGPSARRPIARVRFAIAWAARRQGHGYRSIAEAMGRDRSTIFHAVTCAQNLMKADQDFADLCRDLEGAQA